MVRDIIVAWIPLLALLAVWIGFGRFVSRRRRALGSRVPSDLAGPGDAVTICRVPEVTNILRQYQIEIDGVRVGSVGPGEVRHFPIPPGRHSLAVSIDWCRCHPLVMTKVAGQNARFECGASVKDWRCLIEMFIRPRNYVYIVDVA